ncbi:PrsW family intramembrane metalloprotease [bacterium]|nr:PrsW family intramembrane metalloprotease [bacterium]
MIGLIFLLLAPTAFWLFFFLRRDRFQPEPAKAIISTFLWGMAVTFLAAALEYFFSFVSSLPFIYIFLVIGPVEEFSKYLVLRYHVYPKPEFNELNDGILYASVAALGFATLENFFYMKHFGASVIILRGIFSITGHVAFTVHIGMALAKKKMGMKSSVLGALVVASLLHGVYNYLLMSGNIFLIIIFLPYFFFLARYYFKLSKKMSLLSKAAAPKEVECSDS